MHGMVVLAGQTRGGAAASRLRQGSGLERRRGDEWQARAGMRRDGAGSGLLGRGASGNEAVAMQKAWDGGSGGADARRLLQQAGKQAQAQAGRCIAGARGGAAWGRRKRLAAPRSADNGGAEGCVHAACQVG